MVDSGRVGTVELVLSSHGEREVCVPLALDALRRAALLLQMPGVAYKRTLAIRNH